ncbi:MAG: carboxypeptidase M32, partial [Aquincola sp.]|nr:carboxypeptidase M32 [Aquincola sp.]
MSTPTYDTLVEHQLQLHRFGHLASIVHWDQAANMPPKGNEARAAALAELAALMHRLRTDRTLADRLARAEQEPLSDLQRANLREMRRDWHLANALPESLVQRRQMATSRCEHAWRTQRPANDWAGFVQTWKPVLAIAREEAALLSQQSGLARYDALMDRYEPGMTSATLDRVFGEVRQWLPGLIDRVIDKQSREKPAVPQGPFGIEAQRALCQRIVGLLGFDFEAGRMDVSAHPFCGGVPE